MRELPREKILRTGTPEILSNQELIAVILGKGSHRYNIFNYEAQDSDGYVYEHGFHESKEPSFDSGDISSGQTRRGWVTIEVKEDAEIVAIIVQPLYESSPITIKLHTPLKP